MEKDGISLEGLLPDVSTLLLQTLSESFEVSERNFSFLLYATMWITSERAMPEAKAITGTM